MQRNKLIIENCQTVRAKQDFTATNMLQIQTIGENN